MLKNHLDVPNIQSKRGRKFLIPRKSISILTVMPGLCEGLCIFYCVSFFAQQSRIATFVFLSDFILYLKPWF